MEKPSPLYDISPRYTGISRGDAEANERFYDRMAIRGIPVLRDGDAESDAPVWRGDHSFSPDAATYSLMHFIEPEVAREHPDWTQGQIHAFALERFEKRLAQDLSYEHREIIHEESVVNWRPVETGNGAVELATEYGGKMVTLSQLWEHTKEYAAFAGNPAAYNRAEHEAQLLMQDKLINGSSSGYVSVLSHPDAVRYVQVWQKSDNGDVISQHVDLFAATGKDFSPDEAKELIYHLSDFHSQRIESHDTDFTYAHFFMSQGSVHTDDIRTIAIAQSVHTEESSHEHGGLPLRRLHPGTAVPVAADIAEAIQKTGQYFRVKIEEKIQALTKFIGVAPESRVRVKVSPRESVRSNPTARRETVRARVKEMKKKTGEKEQSDTAISSVLSEWWISRTMAAFVPYLPVASEATLYWFAVLREISVDTAREGPFQSREKYNMPVAAKSEKSAPHSVADVWKLFVLQLKSSFALYVPLAAEKINHGELETHLAPKFTAPVPHEGVLRQKRSERAQTVSWYEIAKILSLFFRFSGETQTGSSLSKEVPAITENLRENGVVLTEAQVIPVGRFMFALILQWLWSEVPGKMRRRNESEVLDSGTMKKGMHGEQVRSEEQLTERVPWMLLSIIWHLSMIRESGTQTASQQKGSRPKRKRKKAAYPARGIIFAFAS